MLDKKKNKNGLRSLQIHLSQETRSSRSSGVEFRKKFREWAAQKSSR